MCSWQMAAWRVSSMSAAWDRLIPRSTSSVPGISSKPGREKCYAKTSAAMTGSGSAAGPGHSRKPWDLSGITSRAIPPCPSSVAALLTGFSKPAEEQGTRAIRPRPAPGRAATALRGKLAAPPAERQLRCRFVCSFGCYSPPKLQTKPAAAFGVLETRIAEPMFQLSLFRIQAFTAGNLAGLATSIARGGLQFVLIIWLQGIWLPLHGYDYNRTPLWAGIFLLPLTAGFLVSGPVAGLLSDTFGSRGKIGR